MFAFSTVSGLNRSLKITKGFEVLDHLLRRAHKDHCRSRRRVGRTEEPSGDSEKSGP